MLMTNRSAYFEYILILLECKSMAYPYFNNLLTANKRFFYICGGISLLRPAPLELPQGGNAARVKS